MIKTIILLFLLTITINAAPVANAGPDRIIFVNQTASLDGSASTGYFDGWRPINTSKDHAIKWDAGFGGFQHQGSLIAPFSYPVVGTFIATLTVCDIFDACNTDQALVTVLPIPPCASEIIMIDSGNPVTNMSNLQSELNASVNSSNRCITLPAQSIWRGALILPHRPVSSFLTIQSSNHSLLLFGKRVGLVDSTNMAIMENPISGSTNQNLPIIDTPATSSNPTRFYNIVGIHFRKAFPNLEYLGLAMINIGKSNETSLTQLPNNIIIDRCLIDGSSTTANSWRGVLFCGSNLSLVNSYIYGFKGISLETQAVLQSQGERNTYMNNFMEGGSSNFLMGGLDMKISNHLPTDISFRRNYVKKNLAWCAVCGQYGGINYSIKNLWEAKLGNRIGIEANIFENHWLEDQTNAIVVTVRNQDGTNPWASIRYLWFAFNKVKNFGEGVQILGSDNLNPSQKIDHITFTNNEFSGASKWNGRHLMFLITSANNMGADRISITQNSSDSNGFGGQGRWIEFNGNINFTNCIINGNIGQGFINFGPQTGEAAMQAACSGGSYSVAKNGFYNSVGTNPAGNTTVSTLADVKYTDALNNNLTLLSNSPFLTTGLANERSGIDSTKLSAMIVGTELGVWGIRKCNWHTLTICN